MEDSIYCISDTFNYQLASIVPIDGISYNTKERYLCVVNKDEFDNLKEQCTSFENINTQLGQGSKLYKITDRTETSDRWYILEVYVYDIYEPYVVNWFNLDWKSPLYLKNATDKIKKWINYIYEEAGRWIPFK